MTAGVSVGAMDLALRLPESLRAKASALERGTREQFLPAMLRAMERRLAVVYGERAVIHIRRLDLKLRLATDELASADLIETLADDLAACVRGQAVQPDLAELAPRHDAPVVIFVDEAHHAAARMLAAARRSPGPGGKRERPASVWKAVRAMPRDTVSRMLVLLMDARCLPEMLSLIGPAEIRALMRDLGKTVPPPLARALERAVAMTESSGRNSSRANPADGAAPGAAGPEFGDETAADPDEAVGFPDPGEEPASLAPSSRRDEPDIDAEPDGLPDQAESEPASGTAGVASADGESEPLGRIANWESNSPRHAPDLVPASIVALEAHDPEQDACAQPAFAFASGWCGLVYLLNIAMRCELPERLWQIGVREGDVLALALGRIAGEDDAGWLVLTDHFPDPPKPVGRVPGWALDELRAGALAAGIRLADEIGEAQLQAEIAEHLARFDAASDDLDAWVAAFLLALFARMTGLAATHLARSGNVMLREDEIIVVQPIDAIDIDVRLAGLDADPGWLAWRHRRMRLVFEGDEAPS